MNRQPPLGCGAACFASAMIKLTATVLVGLALADYSSADDSAAGGAKLSAAYGGAVDVHDCVVRFADEIDVPALATGRVEEMVVAPNAVVAQHDLIAKLDSQSLTIERRAAQLRYDMAREEIADDVEQRYAATALAEAEAELDSGRSIYSDVAGAVPMTQIRRMRLAVERGQLEVARANKRRRQLELELQLREADLSLIGAQLQRLTVISPLEGILLNRHRDAGEWIAAGEPLVTVARIDRLHVHALADSRTLRPADCQDAGVSVHWIDPATEEERVFRGRILSVDPQLLPGARYRVHAEVVNQLEPGSTAAWQLRPGAEVHMKVHVASAVAGQRSVSQPAWMNR